MKYLVNLLSFFKQLSFGGWLVATPISMLSAQEAELVEVVCYVPPTATGVSFGVSIPSDPWILGLFLTLLANIEGLVSGSL